jgi:hypothetical protein
VIIAQAPHQLGDGSADRLDFFWAQVAVADDADQERNPVLVG